MWYRCYSPVVAAVAFLTLGGVTTVKKAFRQGHELLLAYMSFPKD